MIIAAKDFDVTSFQPVMLLGSQMKRLACKVSELDVILGYICAQHFMAIDVIRL